MQSDSAYFIAGRSHEVCQDYAVSGVLADGRHYSIVSDGCSSSMKTEVGSKLLVEACAGMIRTGSYSLEDAVYSSISMASDAARILGLQEESLDATLLVVLADEDNYEACAVGDGVIAVGLADGSVLVDEIEFPSGYPAYLSYKLNPDRMSGYLQVSKGERTVRRSLMKPCGEVELISIMALPVCDSWAYHFPLDGLDVSYVVLLTDGVRSFLKPGEEAGRLEPVEAVDVMRELLAFKTTTGRFVFRRAKRFLEQAADRGWRYTDDLAAGLVVLR